MGILDRILEPIKVKIGEGLEFIDRGIESTEEFRRDIGETIDRTRPSEERVEQERRASIGIAPFAKGAVSFARSMQQFMARSGASVALTALDFMTERDHIRTDISGPDFENRVSRVFFGDEPLRSVEARIADFELSIKDFGQRLGQGKVDVPFIRADYEKSLGTSLDENAIWLAAPGVIAGIGLDFTTGGGTKAVYRQLARTDDAAVITKILRQTGVADDYLPVVTREIQKTSDVLKIEEFFTRYADIVRGSNETTEVAIKSLQKEKVSPTPTLRTYDVALEGADARAGRSVRDSMNSIQNESRQSLPGLTSRPFEGAIEITPTHYKIDDALKSIDNEQFAVRQQLKKNQIGANQAENQIQILETQYVLEAKKRGIATYIDDTGVERALIDRRTGFFVNKEFMTQPMANTPKDIPGKFIRPGLVAQTQDAVAVRTGRFGQVMKEIYTPNAEAIALTNRLKIEMGTKANKVLRDNKVGMFGSLKLSRVTKVWETVPRQDLLFRTNDEIRAAFKLPEGVQGKHINIAREWGQLMDELRGAANVVRAQMNKAPIQFIDKYAPEIRKTTKWREMKVAFFEKDVAKVTAQFDHVTPDSVFNPRALERVGRLAEKEREFNAAKLFDSYVDSLAKDIYISPAMGRTLQHVEALKRRGDVPDVARYWEDYVKFQLAGRATGAEARLLEAGAGRRLFLLRTVIQARVLGAIVGNIPFMMFTQPASTAFTMQHATVRRTVKAFANYLVSPTLRKEVAASSAFRIKAGKRSKRFYGGLMDDADKIVYRGPIVRWNDIWSLPTTAMERHLTGASVAAGLEQGRALGFKKGDDLFIFANEVAEASQSMYNRGSRPTVLDDSLIRGIFPFGTFSLEAGANLRQLFGTKRIPGARAKGKVTGEVQRIGMPKDARLRYGSFVSLVTGVMLFDQMSRRLRGQAVFSPGSFIPLAGPIVDASIDSVFGTEISRFPGNNPIAAAQELGQLNRARVEFQDMTRRLSQLEYTSWINIAKAGAIYAKDGNMTNFRKQLVFWGMGVTGLGAGGSVNRIIDSFIAAERGYVEGFLGQTRLALLGEWSVKSTKEYREEQDLQFKEFKEQEQEKGDRAAQADFYIDYFKQLEKDGEEELINFSWEDIVNNDELLANAIIRKFKIKEKGLTSSDIKLQQLTITDGRRAGAIVKILNGLETDELKSARWNDLAQKKIITQEVNQQIIELLQ